MITIELLDSSTSANPIQLPLPDALKQFVVYGLGLCSGISQVQPDCIVIKGPQVGGTTLAYRGQPQEMLPLHQALEIYQQFQGSGHTTPFHDLVNRATDGVASRIYLVLFGEENVREYFQMLLRLDPSRLADVYNRFQLVGSMANALIGV
jgi:hypothetical protein